MAKPVDAADLKSAGRKAVGVQVPLPPLLMGDPQLERELEQARRLGRWLADDEVAALEQQRQQQLALAALQRTHRRKLIVLAAVCLLIPPLWPLALGITLVLLFPEASRRFGRWAAVALLVVLALVVVLSLAVLVALFALVF